MLKFLGELLRAIPWLAFLFSKGRADRLKAERDELKGLVIKAETKAEVAKMTDKEVAQALEEYRRKADK